MMESNFYSDDFERLIREKTEQYKMYPSEKVWKGVHSSLHTKKRWFIAGMSVLVTGIILVAGKELILPSAHTGPLKKQPLTANLTPSKSTPENTTLPAPFTEFRGPSHAIQGHSPASAPGDGVSMISIVDPGAADGQPSELNNMIGQTSDITATAITGSAGAAMTARGSSAVRSDAAGISGFRTGSHAAANISGTRPADTYISYLTRVRTGNGLTVEEDPYIGQLVITTAFRPGNIPAPGLQIPLHTPTGNRSRSLMQAAELVQPVSADDDDDETEAPDAVTDANNTRQKVNWLQDYAVYSLHPSPRKNKGYWQIYFAPTMNVRGLSGGTPVVSKSGVPPTPIPQASPASAKTPLNILRDMGFEGGGSVLYKISPTLSVKAGLQFNYSKFTLNSYPVAGPAPALAGFNPNSIASPDSGSAAGAAGFARGGQATGLLHNEYYQLSAPVGLELRVWGNDRLQVNVAATVQPTYLLGTTAYLLMADEAGNNSYTKVPSLFRKWNIDGGAEAYIAYKIGGLRMQIGPEFRYQFLSSYSNQYPIRENLNGYGLKIGIIKAIR